VLYDVSTLYFESDAGDGFREPGSSKERRLDPQITIGLLTDQWAAPPPRPRRTPAASMGTSPSTTSGPVTPYRLRREGAE
jgi:hypothetical protein